MTFIITRVEWEDLLRVKFVENGDDPVVGLDCWGQAREIARRAGLAFPDIGPRPTSEAALHLAAFAPCAPPLWVGDIMPADPTKRGYMSHVSVLVDAVNMIVLSTSKEAGAFAWPAHRVSRGLGWHRLRLTL